MSTHAFIFDFDSTIISIESLDEIFKIRLEKDKNKNKIIDQIEAITNLGMSGEIDLLESLTRRLQTASIQKAHIEKLKDIITQYITPSIPEIINFLQEKNQLVFIVSGGFKECILPVADTLNIPHENCFGNEFIFNKEGHVTGINKENPLCRSDGKPRIIKQLKTSPPDINKVYIVGDGYTDLVPYLEGVADEFLGFGVHQIREKVRANAPHFFETSEEVLNYLQSIDFSS